MPKRNDLTISKRTVDGLSAAEDTVFWDHELPGFGVRVYPHGPESLRRPEPGPGRAEARHPGPAWRYLGRTGARQGGWRHRPHQAGRGSGPPAASARAHRGRSGGALHGGACGGELQCAHRRDLPGIARQPYPAGIGRAGDRGGRAGTCRGAALRASRYAPRGEPGADGSHQDVLPGRGVGPGPGGHQPLPLRGQVQGASARAVPDAGRVPAAGPGDGRGARERRDLAAGGGGAASSDADRLPGSTRS